jgi:hypothetical protein
VEGKGSALILEKLRALTPRSNKTSISPALSPFGSGSRKYDQTKEEAKLAPHEPSLSLQIPSSRIENGWVEEVGYNACDVVTVASNDNTLDPQTCRWNLRNKTVTDRSDCDVVCEHKQHEEATGDLAQNSWAVIWNSHKSDSDENSEHDSQAAKIERSSADVSHNRPIRHPIVSVFFLIRNGEEIIGQRSATRQCN